jgi:hypothetical protein
MPDPPSARALDFGRQYAETLNRWSELFAAAAALVEANVAMGESYASAAGEFEGWMQSMAKGPAAWMGPDAMSRWGELFGSTFAPGVKKD